MATGLSGVPGAPVLPLAETGSGAEVGHAPIRLRPTEVQSVWGIPPRPGHAMDYQCAVRRVLKLRNPKFQLSRNQNFCQ